MPHDRIKILMVKARKTSRTIYNILQNCYKPKWDLYFLLFLNRPLWQVIFFVIFLFFFKLSLLSFFHFSFFFWAPNSFISFRPFYPIKNIQLKQLERMASTPLYGSHITIVWWGPQGPRTSCSQDNLWPFWIDPWDPQLTHVYITD